MGNSQSMDKAQKIVKQGINIYQKVKKEQEQQGQQQQNNNNNNNNYNNNDHSNNNNNNTNNHNSNSNNNHSASAGGSSHHTSSAGGSTYHPSADVDDDEQYSKLRAQAHEEAEKRNDCYAKSQEAYKNGDGSEAKELSNQGHCHDNLMKQYNQQAADHIFSVKNQGRPSNEIDLHGLFVKEASAKVEETVRRCQANGEKDLVIIVGKGLHSPNQIAKLKPAIIELVKKYQVTCQPNIPNPGCLYIEFGKGTGDISWLDVFTEKMSNNDQCLIM